MANHQAGLVVDYNQHNNIGAVWAFDRVFASPPRAWADPVSDATALLAAATPLGLLLVSRERSQRFTLAVMAFETAVYTSAVVFGLKWAVARPRPYLYYSPSPYGPHSPDSYHSFVSGHTAVASSLVVFTAVTWHRLNKQSFKPVWALAGLCSLALGTAALRVVAGKHFVSDVAAGMLLGGAVGWAVPRLHAGGKHKGVTLMPYPGGMYLAITL
jgi:membrane-associated phospholipid phosphatase